MVGGANSILENSNVPVSLFIKVIPCILNSIGSFHEDPGHSRTRLPLHFDNPLGLCWKENVVV